MIRKTVSPSYDLTEAKIAIRSPLFVAPIALAMLACTIIGLSAPYMHFDLTAKIQKSLLH